MLRYLVRKKEEEVHVNVIYEHHQKTNSECSDTKRHIEKTEDNLRLTFRAEQCDDKIEMFQRLSSSW